MHVNPTWAGRMPSLPPREKRESHPPTTHSANQSTDLGQVTPEDDHPPATRGADQPSDLGQVTPEHYREDGTHGSGGGCQAPSTY